MKNYSNIFNTYQTTEGFLYHNLSKRVVFPFDESLDMYARYYVDEDVPWTILSYQLYGSIDYWWVLTSLNKDMVFYAERGNSVLVIRPDYLTDVLKRI